MEWRDTLLAISQIAITIAGFAGVVGMFARDRISRSSVEFLRLRFMLEYSFVTLGFSLLPFLVFPFGFTEAASWRTSSAIAIFAFIAYAIVNRRFLAEISVTGTRLERLAGLGDLLTVLLLALNASGYLFEPNALPYLVAVYWQLCGAAIGFFRLIALVWSRSGPDSTA